jgi:heme-degrading monooxygenase HmoA
MAVLEICHLKIKSHLGHTDPSLLAALQKARSELRDRVVDTQSRFYQCMEDPSSIYLFGIWPSTQRHDEFLSSAEKSAILDGQEAFFDFGWILHVAIASLADLPLAAPVLSLGYFKVRDGEEGAFQRIWDKYGGVLATATAPYPSLGAWRIDAEEGKREYVVVTGWEDKAKHDECRQSMRGQYEDFAAVRDTCTWGSVIHARDMEGGLHV